jgi:Tfp pilus assembly protein PilN
VKQEYFIRLGTVTLFALAAIVLASGALLAPSYLYLNTEIQARSNQLSALEAQLGATVGSQASSRLSALSGNAAYLARLASTSSATAALRNVLSAPHTGISLVAFSITPAKHGNDGTMTLTGTASTRETLRAYNDALSHVPGVTNGDLPISAYAQDSNIPFSIKLTGSFMP